MPGRPPKPTRAKTRRQPKTGAPNTSCSLFTPPQPAQPATPNRIALILRRNQAHEGR